MERVPPCCACLCDVCLRLTCAADYDVLIRNARVIDGSGNPWFRADVGVREDGSPRSGSLARPTATGHRCRGRVVAPGLHRCSYACRGRDGKGSPRRQLPPRRRNHGHHRQLRRLGSAIWLSGFRKLEKTRPRPERRHRLSVTIPSASEVMGTANRQATPDEIEKMQALVEKAMRDGAVGFSTGSDLHSGHILEHRGSRGARARLRQSMAAFMRATCATKASKVFEAIEEAVTVGKEAGMPVEFSHFKIDNKSLWGSSTKSLALVERVPARGRRRRRRSISIRPFSTNLGILAAQLGAGRWRRRDPQSGCSSPRPGHASPTKCRRSSQLSARRITRTRPSPPSSPTIRMTARQSPRSTL